MKVTRYFVEQVLRKRPYIQQEWCERVLASPLHREEQPDGRGRGFLSRGRLPNRRALRGGSEAKLANGVWGVKLHERTHPLYGWRVRCYK